MTNNLKVSKQSLQWRLYDRGNGACDVPAESVPRPPSGRPRPESAGARGVASRRFGGEAQGGTLNVQDARKLLDNLRSSGQPPSQPRQPVVQPSLARPKAMLPRPSPGVATPRMAESPRTAVKRGAVVRELPPLADTPGAPPRALAVWGWGSETGATANAAMSPVHAGEQGAPSAERDLGRDSFAVFLQLLRGAPLHEQDSLEFVYVRHVLGAGPYELELMPFYEVDTANYMTLSPHGFTKYRSGDSCEFVPLDRWLEERRLYHAVRELHFFRDFGRRKAFDLWRDAGARERMAKASAALEANLFVLHAQFRPLLLAVRRICLDLSELRAARVHFPQPFQVHDFQIQQESWQADTTRRALRAAASLREETATTFAAVLEEVRKKSSVARAQESLGSHMRPVAQKVKRQAVQVRMDGEVLEALGFPKDSGYGQRSQLRKECGSFMRLAKLADQLTADALVELVQGSLADILRSLEPRTNVALDFVFKAVAFAPMLDGGSTADGPTVHLSPSHTEMEAVLLDAVSVGCGVVRVFRRLCAQPELECYRAMLDPMDPEWRQGPSSSAMKVTNDASGANVDHPDALVMESLVALHSGYTWQGNLTLLKTAVQEASSGALEKLQFLGEHIGRCARYLNADISAKVASACDRGMVKTLGDLLDEYQLEADALQQLPATVALFPLEVDIANIKALLFVGPTNCLTELREALPARILHQNEALSAWMRAKRHQLSDTPTSVAAYAQQLTTLQEVGVEVHSQGQYLERTRELCDIADQRGIESQGRRQASNVARDMFEFRQWCASKDLEMSQLREHFEAELEGHVKELDVAISELARDVRTDDFLTLETYDGTFAPAVDCQPPAKWLIQSGEEAADGATKVDRLRGLSARREQICATFEAYRRYQDLFAVPRAESPEMEAIEDDLGALTILWETMVTWINECKAWMCAPLQSIVVADMAQRLAELSGALGKAQEGLGENPVLEELRCHFRLLQDCLPPVQALQNSYLKERHWLAISDILGDHLFGPSGGRGELLGFIIELDIARHAENVLEISARATQEHFIEVTLRGVDEFWRSAELPVEHVRDARGVPVLGSVDHIAAQLEDSLVSVGRALASHFTQLHPEDVENARFWLHRLSAAREALSEWRTCQQAFTYLEKIFAVMDMQRQLISETVAFQTVEERWKRIMLDAQQNPNFMHAVSPPELTDSLRGLNRDFETIKHDLNDYLATKRMAFPRLYFLSNDELLKLLSNGRELGAMEHQLQLCFSGVSRLEFDERSTDIHGVVSREGERMPIPRAKVCAHVEETLSFIQAGMFTALNKAMRFALEEAEDKVDLQWAVAARFPAQVTLVAARIAWCRRVESELPGARGAAHAAEVMTSLKNWHNTARLAPLLRSVATGASRKTSKEDILSVPHHAGSTTPAPLQHTLPVLIMAELQGRDVLEALAACAGSGTPAIAHCFEWRKQLRFYCDEGERETFPRTASLSQDKGMHCPDSVSADVGVTVHHLGAHFEYGYEYQGACQRLVATPLTDRCFVTISQAAQLRLGSVMHGPAGVGKTETVRDLAKALATACIVFYCNDRVTQRMTAQLISGLAQQGCWAVLDNVNRINVEALSALAQQVRSVHLAQLAQRESLEFEGAILPLKLSSNFCVTMRPEGETGTTDLPLNLKALFRPVYMVAPDYGHICESVLIAYGFQAAGPLARKATALHRFSMGSLSQEAARHFGLRELRAALARAAHLRTDAVKRQHGREDSDVGVIETFALARALAETIGGRLTGEDTKTFRNLHIDFFPLGEGGEPDNETKAAMAAKNLAVRAACEIEGALPIGDLVPRVLELLEAQAVRPGVMLFGPAGSGKSTLLRVLARVVRNTVRNASGERAAADAEASSEGSERIPALAGVDILNPKTFAQSDSRGGGAFEVILRRHAAHARGSPSTGLPWVVFDGPVDPTWTDKLWTVLDEDRVLYLPNLERVPLSPKLKIFFEVDDLSNASPSTVTRCGAVCKSALGSRAAQKWLMACVGEARSKWISQPAWDHLLKLVRTLVPKALKHLRNATSNEVLLTMQQDVQLFASFHQILCAVLAPEPYRDRLVTPAALHGTTTTDTQNAMFDAGLTAELDTERYLSACFAFAVSWGLGSSASTPARSQLSLWCRNNIPRLFLPTDGGIGKRNSTLLRRGQAVAHDETDLFDLVVNWYSNMGYFEKWDHMLPGSLAQAQGSEQLAQPLSQLLVPSATTACYAWLAVARARRQVHTILTGPTGSGKSIVGTVVIRQPQQVQQWTFVDIALTRSSTAERVQAAMVRRLHQKDVAVLGAPPGTLVFTFVDDVALPARDAAGAQPPLELLRQTVDMNGGLYDQKTWQWRRVVEMGVLATCALPRSTEADPWLPGRFLRHFQVMALPAPSRQTLSSVFGGILGRFFSGRDAGGNGFVPTSAGLGQVVCDACVELLVATQAAFRPSPVAPWHSFSIRDVQRVVQGILMVRRGIGGYGTPTDVAKLWAHECTRVFADRLVSDADLRTFQDILDGLVLSQFAIPWRSSSEVLPMRFGDFVRTGLETKQYEQIEDDHHLEKFFHDSLVAYNSQAPAGAPPLRLVFFTEAADHLCRILRIMRQPRGHVLLMGRHGAGRRSLCCLAASILEMRRYLVEEEANALGTSDGLVALKSIMRTCGVKGQNSMLLLADDDGSSEHLWEEVNTLLSIGHIPNLWTAQEAQSIKKELALVGTMPAAELGVEGSQSQQFSSHYHQHMSFVPDEPEAAWRLFVSRLRDQLHVVVCMSTERGRMHGVSRRIPSLLTCCAIDYFRPWPEAAMQAVAAYYLDELPNPITGRASATHQALAPTTVCAYNAAVKAAEAGPEAERRCIRLTLRELMDHCIFAVAHMGRASVDLEKLRKRTEAGLTKLRDTVALARSMEKDVATLKPALQKSERDAERISGQIVEGQRSAADIRLLAVDEKEAAAVLDKKIDALTKDTKAALDTVLPDYIAVKKELDKLERKDLQELRGLASPPAIVALIVECVCMLLGLKTDWTTAKTVLSDPNFIKRLKEFDKDSLSEKVLSKLIAYNRRDGFEPEKAEKHNAAARVLCLWCRALGAYGECARSILPKQEELGRTKQHLLEADHRLAAKEADIGLVLSHVANLEAQKVNNLAEQAALQAERDLTEQRWTRAMALISSFEYEEIRWDKIVAKCTKDLVSLPGRVLLAGACVAYYGAFSPRSREALVAKWADLYSHSGAFGPAGHVGDAWVLQDILLGSNLGLDWPSVYDAPGCFRANSAVVAMKSFRWPLCLDPQGHARRWLQSRFGPEEMKCDVASSGSLSQSFEHCQQTGACLLVLGCGDDLPAALRPMAGRWRQAAAGPSMQDAGKLEDCAIFLVTIAAAPRPSPQTLAAVSVVSFVADLEGVAEALLIEVVRLERPGLDERRTEMWRLAAAAREQLVDHEAEMLKLLGGAEGSVVDQPELADSVAALQERVASTTAQAEAKRASWAALAPQRAAYLPAARGVAAVYCVGTALAAARPEYSCSLEVVSRLLVGAVQRWQAQENEAREVALRGEDADGERAATLLSAYVAGLAEASVSCVLSGLLRGFFGEHRMAAAAAAAIELARLRGEISNEQKRLFLLGADIPDGELPPPWGTPVPPASPAPAAPVSRSASRAVRAQQRPALAPARPATPSARPTTKERLRPTTKERTSSPDPICFPHATWQMVQAMARLLPDCFSELPAHMEEHLGAWRAVHAADNNMQAVRSGVVAPAPGGASAAGAGSGSAGSGSERVSVVRVEAEDDAAATLLLGLPAPWCDAARLGFINTLLLLRAVRPTCLLQGLRSLVARTMGRGVDLDRAWTLFDAVESASNRLPVFVLLGSGCNPATELSKVAEEVRGGAHFLRVGALRRAEGFGALRTLEAGRASGHWVLLELGELAPELLSRVERIVFEVAGISNSDMRVHEDFRLFFTASVATCIPATLLHHCARATDEPPQSMRACLNQYGARVDRGAWNAFPTEPAWQRLLLATAVFHGAVLMRGRMGPPGFGRAYAFDAGDLEVAVASLALLLADSDYSGAHEWPQAAIEASFAHALAEIHYGGCVLDEFDRRCLVATFNHVARAMQGSPCAIDGVKRYQIEGDVADRGPEALRALYEILPEDDDLEFFGLHTHVGAILRQREMRNTFALLVQVGFRTGADVESERLANTDVSALAEHAANSLKGRLARPSEEIPSPASRNAREHDGDHYATYAPETEACPLRHFLRRELGRLDTLLRVVHASLDVVVGRRAAEDGLDNLAADLARGRVPASWRTYAYPSGRALHSWAADLRRRTDALWAWRDDGGLPSCFWLPGFFSPSGFLVATLHRFVREESCSFDCAEFQHVVQTFMGDAGDAHLLQPLEGCSLYVVGLFMEGARWDVHSRRIEDIRPGEAFCQLPAIRFDQVINSAGTGSIIRSDSMRGTSAMSFRCPLYRTVARITGLSNVDGCVDTVSLPTVAPSDQWVLRGAALLLEAGD